MSVTVTYRMKLLSDTVFGSGRSVPGGEDIGLTHDEYGFPYMKGSTIKGVFREECENYFSWINEANAEGRISGLFGSEGYSEAETGEPGQIGPQTTGGRLIFSNVMLSEAVRQVLKSEIEKGATPDDILNSLTYLRTFTQIGSDGVVKEGSLRSLRCIKKGISFCGQVICGEDDVALVKEVLRYIKWIGTMRTRGFGKVTFITDEDGCKKKI